jgi:hypothetical protein
MAKRTFIFTSIPILVLLLTSAVIPLASHADPISFTFSGVNGQIDSGYYIGPYLATVNNVSGTEIYCIDFTHEVNFGDTYTVYTTSVTGPYDHTYLTDSVKYKEMAWLLSQFPGQDSLNHAAMQWVIWDISSGQDHSSYHLTEYNYWLNQAQTKYMTADYGGWQILTDVHRDRQEFLTRSAVPEPSTLILLGSGLLAAWGFRKNFKKA